MFYDVPELRIAGEAAGGATPGVKAVGGNSFRLFAEVLSPTPATDHALPGNVRTVVLLHPTPVDHRFWAAIAPMLSSRYRVIMPDLRGHGKSSMASAGDLSESAAITIEQLGLDMAALLDLLHVERAVFIGCSIGGYLLYELWRTMPARIAGLVFCSSKPQADTPAERTRRTEWIAKIKAGGTGEFIETMLGALLGVEARSDEELVAKASQMMQTATPEAIIAVQRGLGLRPDSRPTAATITVPSLVIGGEQDTSSTPEDLSALTQLLRTGGNPVGHERFADAGHYAPFEDPQQVGALLRSFCDGVLL